MNQLELEYEELLGIYYIYKNKNIFNGWLKKIINFY